VRVSPFAICDIANEYWVFEGRYRFRKVHGATPMALQQICLSALSSQFINLLRRVANIGDGNDDGLAAYVESDL